MVYSKNNFTYIQHLPIKTNHSCIHVGKYMVREMDGMGNGLNIFHPTYWQLFTWMSMVLSKWRITPI